MAFAYDICMCYEIPYIMMQKIVETNDYSKPETQSLKNRQFGCAELRLTMLSHRPTRCPIYLQKPIVRETMIMKILRRMPIESTKCNESSVKRQRV